MPPAERTSDPESGGSAGSRASTATRRALAEIAELSALPDETGTERLQRATEKLSADEWEELEVLTRQTGLRTALAMRTGRANGIPGAMRKRNEQLRRQQAGARIQHEWLLGRIPQLREMAGEQPIVFKGPVTAWWLRNAESRSFVDIDVMVSPAGRRRLSARLETAGWRWAMDAGRMTTAYKQAGAHRMLELLQRHDHWDHPVLGKLEVHSRASDDHTRTEWSHGRMLQDAREYRYGETTYTGCGLRTLASLSVWNVIKDGWWNWSRAEETWRLLQWAGGADDAVPRHALHLLEAAHLFVATGEACANGITSPLGMPEEATSEKPTPAEIEDLASRTWMKWSGGTDGRGRGAAGRRIKETTRRVEADGRKLARTLSGLLGHA